MYSFFRYVHLSLLRAFPLFAECLIPLKLMLFLSYPETIPENPNKASSANLPCSDVKDLTIPRTASI